MNWNSLFPLQNSWLLVVSLLLGITSIVLFSRERFSWALACLFCSGIFVRLFLAHLDPFLHEWDERFHALVARNMMHDPFKPMLRVSEWLHYDYKEWCCNHIWLHKQPLFMWQMALSMKLFGVSEYALRYPGVLMGSISILLVYRISLLMTANRQIAFMAAVLACFSYFQLELLSGYYGMDQNDTAFDFYVLCSIWAYTEYIGRKTLKYALLIGLFAGCAVLNKWLAGVLVFSAWGIVILLDSRKGNFKNDVIHFLVALVVCCIVFLPWQFYILHRFPTEARYEYAYNALHLTNAVESHSGDWLFYINAFDRYFGQVLCYLLPVGFLLALFLKRYHNRTTLSLSIYFILAFAFFSFIAQTKNLAYFMIVVPLGQIFIALCVYHIIHFGKLYKYAFIPVMIAIALLSFNLSTITNSHDPRNVGNNNWLDWTTKAHNAHIYKDFKNKVSPGVRYVFNAKDVVDFMFYNNNVDAYGWVINADSIAKLKQRHVTIAIYQKPGDNGLPQCLVGYDSLYVIRAEFK